MAQQLALYSNKVKKGKGVDKKKKGPRLFKPILVHKTDPENELYGVNQSEKSVMRGIIVRKTIMAVKSVHEARCWT